MSAFITSLRKCFEDRFAVIYFAGLLIIAQAMRRSHGSLKSNHLIFISILTLFVFFDRFQRSSLKEGAKFLGVAIFLIMGIAKFEIIYASSSTWGLFYRVTLFILLCSCSLMKFYGAKSLLKYLNFFLIGVLFCCVPFASSAPNVDVWVYFEKAVGAMNSLVNPYTLTYPDIYQGAHHYNPKFIYWPMSLYLMAPIKWFADVRFSLVIALFASAYLLKRDSSYTHWDILIFLLFPINFFVIEQSWIEPLMIPFLILHFQSLRNKDYKWAAIWLGALCALKQFMLAPFLLSSLYLLRVKGFKHTLIAPAFILLTFFPFLILTPETFIQNTFLEFLRFPARADSLSWVAHFLFHYDYELSGTISALLYLGTFIFCAYKLWQEQSLLALKSGYFLTLAVTFLFGKQSFANYYFLLFMVYFLCLRRSSDKDPKSSTSQVACE